MPDARISELPAATAPGDTDIAPLVQTSGATTETRRATIAQLRSAVLTDRGAHVRDYGAKGDGVTNDAPAIQAAINDLKAKGGGTLQFGAKVYRIASAITISDATIRFQGMGFTEGPGAGQGTWLLIPSTSFTPFTFTGVNTRGSAVRDIAVQQLHTNALNASWTPNNYDYVFRVVDSLGGVDFDNVFLCNINKGIHCINSGRLDIRRLRGQVFTTGIEIDNSLDVPRIHNLHFWTFLTSDNNVVRWQQANGDAMVFRRCDGVFIDQAFVLGYRSMFRFASSAFGNTTKFYIGQAYADFVQYAVWVEADGTDGQIGSITTQGEIFNAGGAAITGSYGIFVNASNTRIQAANVRIDAVQDNAIRIAGSGNRMDIFALRCVRFNAQNNGAAAIHLVDSGAGTPNTVYLGSPVLTEQANGGPVVNSGTNGILASGAPAGRVARPGVAVGSTDTGIYLPIAGSLAGSAGGVEVLRATSAGAVTLGAAPGSHALEVATPASTANRMLVSGATTGAAVTLQAQGADANIGITITPKGSGLLRTTTASTGDNSTAVATTAWVKLQGYGTGGVSSVAGRTGAVTLGIADIADAAPLAAPVFTGSLTLPTWTTAARPSPATVGMLGWNTELLRYDHCIAGGTPGTWAQFARLSGDTLTGALMVNNAGGGNVARMQGAASGTGVVFGADTGSADTNVPVAIVTKGSGSLSATLPDGTIAGGNARGANAVDWQSVRTAPSQAATGSGAVIAGGINNTASGSNSAIGGGNTNTVISGAGWIPGGQQATSQANIHRGAWSSGRFSANGDAQAGEFVLRRQSSDATTVRLTADNAAQAGQNTLNVPNNGSYLVRVMVLARQTGGAAGTAGDCAGWTTEVLVKRGANAAATTLLGGNASLAPSLNDTGAAAWRLALAADATNGGLALSGTGEANKTINWVARIMSVEAVG